MTLLELKMKKAELRDRMDAERKENGNISAETFVWYNEIIRRLAWAESILLKPIVISLMLMLFAQGCNTARETLNLGKAVGQDGAWILGKMSDNIQTQEK